MGDDRPDLVAKIVNEVFDRLTLVLADVYLAARGLRACGGQTIAARFAAGVTMLVGMRMVIVESIRTGLQRKGMLVSTTKAGATTE